MVAWHRVCGNVVGVTLGIYVRGDVETGELCAHAMGNDANPGAHISLDMKKLRMLISKATAKYPAESLVENQKGRRETRTCQRRVYVKNEQVSSFLLTSSSLAPRGSTIVNLSNFDLHEQVINRFHRSKVSQRPKSCKLGYSQYRQES